MAISKSTPNDLVSVKTGFAVKDTGAAMRLEDRQLTVCSWRPDSRGPIFRRKLLPPAYFIQAGR